MLIEVKLFAYFRDDRFKIKTFDLEAETSVRKVITELGINPEEVGVTMINGRHCQLDTTLNTGDSLGIFPMIGGG